MQEKQQSGSWRKQRLQVQNISPMSQATESIPDESMPYGLVLFCWSLKKFTRAYLFQIALEIMWLPIPIRADFFRVALYFSEPRMGEKKTSNEQNVRSYYMPNHRIRGLYKKSCYFTIGFYFFGKSIHKHPDSVCEDDVNNEQNLRAQLYMPNHWMRR